jgi:drug/metabolite transporter (DMT)-like permease
VHTTLSIFDLIAIRFGVSGLVVLPFILYFKPWKTLTLFRAIVYSFLLGPIYMMFVFSGFIYAPASHSAVFFNGFLPFLTLIITSLWLKKRISRLQIISVFLILLGAFLILLDGASLKIENSWLGDLLFLIAGLLFAIYIVVSREWKITISELIFCTAFLNFLIYLPIWIIFIPKNFGSISNTDLFTQIIFQGIVPNLIGLLLVTIAVKKIGSAPTSAFLAGVPATASILSFFILGEYLGIKGWIGIVSITPGILILALFNKSKAL